MNEKRRSIEEIEADLRDLKKRWPAHSVRQHMFQELEDLENELAEAKKRIAGNGIKNPGN